MTNKPFYLSTDLFPVCLNVCYLCTGAMEARRSVRYPSAGVTCGYVPLDLGWELNLQSLEAAVAPNF